MNIERTAKWLEVLSKPARLSISFCAVGGIQKKLLISGLTLSHYIAKQVNLGLVLQVCENHTLICKARVWTRYYALIMGHCRKND